jgi:hypothetical protein
MTPELAEKLKAPITTCKKMKVLVADGGELFTEFMYTDCLYTIQEEQFKSDFRILKLKGYDIILDGTGCMSIAQSPWTYPS